MKGIKYLDREHMQIINYGDCISFLGFTDENGNDFIDSRTLEIKLSKKQWKALEAMTEKEIVDYFDLSD